MLWSMAFDRVAVVVSDIYFRDPNPAAGQEGAERGVRLELRNAERGTLNGSIYSAVPIAFGRPLWRVDLLGSVNSVPGSLDRAHHHPRFREWEPGVRTFVPELSADPVQWLREQFARIETVLATAGYAGAPGDKDIESLRAAGPTIVGMVEHLLAEVAAGRAALPPEYSGDAARESWL